MVTEYQSHNGAVNTSTTPSVQYPYSFVTSSGGPNNSWLVSMTYPNGRVLNYNYNSSVDDRISRLSSISDSTGTLEAYSYPGLNTVVTRSHPQTGINQTYLIPGGNSDGGDQYTGLDRFGRVVEEKWLNPNTNTVTDDFLYSYDRDGNRLTSNNALHSYFHETFAYDNLNRLTSFTRGGTAQVQNWTLDAVGNWLSSTTFNGLTDNRTFNNQNQITSNSTAATPTYDADGNTITDDNGTQYLYDAWNRIIKTVAGSNTMYYTYDALGRRITIETNLNPVLDEYFSSNWQVVEEDQQGVVQNQYVWSSVHVLNTLKPIALCQPIYDGYTIAQAQAGGYKTETDCKKPRTKYLARSAEVVGHKQYISRGCDYVLPGSISKGSAKQEKNYKIELAKKIVALTRCWARYNVLCCNK